MAQEDEKIIFQIILDQVAASKNLAELKKQLREMIAALPTDKNSEGFKTMSVGAKLLREQIAQLEGATKANTNSLGGVNEAAKFTAGSYGQLRQNIKLAKEELQKAVIGSEDFKTKQESLNVLLQKEIDLRKEQPSLFQERVKAAVIEANSIEGLKQKLVELNSTASKLNLNSEEFKEVQEEIINTQDALKIAGGRIDEFGKKIGNSTAEQIEDFGKVGTAVVASFGVANTIFGESEDAQKALLAVTESIQLVQSAQAIVSGVLASKTVIMTIATGAQAVATKGLELAQRGLNAAMSSNPIIAIITGITTLIALLGVSSTAYASETKEIKKNADATGELSDARKELITQLDELVDKELAAVGIITEAEAEKRKIISDAATQTATLQKTIDEASKADAKGTVEERKKLIIDSLAQIELIREISHIKQLDADSRFAAEEKKKAEERIEAEQEKNKKVAELKQRAFDEMFAITIADLERQSDLDHQVIQDKIDAEAQRIELEIATLKEGDELKLQLRLQTLATERDALLAQATTGSQEEANIKEGFRQAEQAAIDLHFQTLTEKFANQNAEKLAAELINIELAGQSTTSKLIEIENAEFERQKNDKILKGQSIELLQAQHQKNLTAIHKKEADNRANISNAEFTLTKNILNSYAAIGEIMAGNQEEAAEFAKGVAIFNIGLSTAQAIAQMATIAKGLTPIDYAIQYSAGIAVILANVASAKKLIVGQPKGPELQKFDTGGSIAYEGGNIPFNGGMITGRSHSTGGVKFAMGNKVGEADGRKGEAYIVNTTHDPFLKAAASALNVAGGGRAFFNHGGSYKFQDGGLASRAAVAGSDLSQQFAQAVADQFSRLPPPVTYIDDIKLVNDRVNSIQERASL